MAGSNVRAERSRTLAASTSIPSPGPQTRQNNGAGAFFSLLASRLAVGSTRPDIGVGDVLKDLPVRHESAGSIPRALNRIHNQKQECDVAQGKAVSYDFRREEKNKCEELILVKLHVVCIARLSRCKNRVDILFEDTVQGRNLPLSSVRLVIRLQITNPIRQEFRVSMPRRMLVSSRL